MTKKRGKKGLRPPRGAALSAGGHFNPIFQDETVFSRRKGPSAPMEQDVVHPAAPKTVPAEDEDRIFLEAVSGVIPLSPSAKKTVMPVPDPRRRPAHPPPDDELETMAHLYDLISGTAELDITFSDEFIEGAVPGFDRKLMLRLKRGEFALQDHVDLHGLTKQEAEVSVQRFLTQSYHRGLRCVLVITGRGLNSENQIPILKERLPVWLRQGPARKIVLAFSTARPYDGGMGAIYVLLRRRRNPSPVP